MLVRVTVMAQTLRVRGRRGSRTAARQQNTRQLSPRSLDHIAGVQPHFVLTTRRLQRAATGSRGRRDRAPAVSPKAPASSNSLHVLGEARAAALAVDSG